MGIRHMVVPSFGRACTIQRRQYRCSFCLALCRNGIHADIAVHFDIEKSLLTLVRQILLVLADKLFPMMMSVISPCGVI